MSSGELLLCEDNIWTLIISGRLESKDYQIREPSSGILKPALEIAFSADDTQTPVVFCTMAFKVKT
jgi:hypothetical protein